MVELRVSDLMVPLSEYATVGEGATLFEAVLALEKAQEDYDHTKYRHRAVLVLDGRGRVVGKLAQIDVLRALEPADDQAAGLEALRVFGFSEGFVHRARRLRRLEARPLADICRKAAGIRVEQVMQRPAEGEYIGRGESLDQAIVQLVAGRHLSLLVTEGEEIVGVLRLSDVFAAVFHAMKECGLPEPEGGA